MRGARQLKILLKDDGKLDDEIKTDQWRSSVRSIDSAISDNSRDSWSLLPSSLPPLTRSSSSPCVTLSSSATLLGPQVEIPPFSWERVAVNLGRGKSAEEIKEASIETLTRLAANFIRLNLKVREERLASIAMSEKNRVPAMESQDDVPLDMGSNLGTQSHQNMGRVRWKTQELAFWRIKQKKRFPANSSSDSEISSANSPISLEVD